MLKQKDNIINTEMDNQKANGIKEFNPIFDDTLLSPETFIEHTNDLLRESQKPQETIGLFMVKTADRWLDEAKKRPIPRQLFDVFWHEGELCILFSDTNIGKSILAVQIGNSISRGENIPGFGFEATLQKIVYFDFELSDKQFEARYSINYEQHYPFNENFIRAEVNPESSDYKEHGFDNFDDYLNHSIEQTIIETNAKILIIDNITYLKDDTEKAKFALPLMKHLQTIKKKYNLSILCIAHTPKRDLSKPLSRNDVMGSKMLMNFCDSSFCIGESSQDKSFRYLKQIKMRFTEAVYDSDNVCVCHVCKPDNFLLFEFLNYGREQEHLKQISESEKSELESSVANLLMVEPGISAYEIAKRLCPDGVKFESFKVKINRIVKKISNNSNT